MGPDENATREELGLIVKVLFAKLDQQTFTIATLAGMLIRKQVISEVELAEMVEELAQSPQAAKAKEAYGKLSDYAAIRKIARQYLDLPPEEL